MYRHHIVRFSLLIVTLLVTISSFSLFAQSNSQKSAAVRKLEKQRTELLNAIKKTDLQIKTLGKDKSQKQQQEKLLRQQVNDRIKVIKILDQEVAVLNKSIDSLGTQIVALQIEEKRILKSYERTIVSMHRRPSTEDRLLFLLSAGSFDEGVRRLRYLTSYARAHKQVAEELRRTRQDIEQSRRTLRAHKEEKGHLLRTRAEEKTKLETQRASVSKEVQQLSSEQGKLQKQLKQQKKKAQQLEQAIQAQIEKEIREAERKAREEQERREREAKKRGQKETPKQSDRRAETRGGYAMDASERALAKTFAANKGKLPPPVTASYRVIRRFGLQQHEDLSKVQTRNGGIDIQVAAGTSVVAVFDGVVSKVFSIPGYHNSVIIRHGNYLTVYANLINVSVTSGQKVSTGQRIGTVATDSETGQGLMQFQVWHERTKQNPQAWIR